MEHKVKEMYTFYIYICGIYIYIYIYIYISVGCSRRKGRGPIFELPHAGEKDAEHGSTRQISPATVFGRCSERYGGVLVTCVTSHPPRAGFEPLVCATESFSKSGSESNDSRSDRSASNQ